MNSSASLRLLGQIQVERNGTPISSFESRKSLALLAYLAYQEQSVSRSQLAGLFWGDKSEDRGRRNLSRELSYLTAEFPDSFQNDYYTVQCTLASTAWLDTAYFQTLAGHALDRQIM